jgi:CubicO group peptidase (beta-lactamase class C family)
MKPNATIDALLQNAVKAGDVAGVSATVASTAGVLYEGAAGSREVGQDRPMKPDTIVWIASMTKAITGAAAMQLVERGKLALDKPAAEVVPELGRTQVLEGFSADGQPQLRKPKRPITLRNLLTHSSGFSYTIWDENAVRYEQVTNAPNILAGTRASIDVPLMHDPDAQWSYGPGIDWAGRMVEEASGQRLGAYMKANLFEPLGMSSTAFDLSPAQRERVSSVHARLPDGGLAVMPFALPPDAELQAGGHALYSTAQDYLKFTQMILHGGRLGGAQVLKPETVQAMGKNQMGDLRVRFLKTAAPGFSYDCEFYPGIPCTWGLSFLINTQDTPEGRSAGSLSWAGLSNCYYWIDPVKKLTGVLMSQSLPFFDAKVLKLFRAFETAVNKG